jgi:hypothetical protein
MRLTQSLGIAALLVIPAPAAAYSSFHTTASSHFYFVPGPHGGIGGFGFLGHGMVHSPRSPFGGWGSAGLGHGSWNDGPGDARHLGRGEGGGGSGDNPGGGTPPDIGGADDPPTTVTPEPVSMTLLATGLAGVGAAGIRRRRKIVSD